VVRIANWRRAVSTAPGHTTTGWTWGTSKWLRSPSGSATPLTSCASCKSMDAGDDAMKVRVEYTYDPQSRNWCFQVPSLGIIGGADTREQAEEQAIEALGFTLESANEATAPAESEV